MDDELTNVEKTVEEASKETPVNNSKSVLDKQTAPSQKGNIVIGRHRSNSMPVSKPSPLVKPEETKEKSDTSTADKENDNGNTQKSEKTAAPKTRARRHAITEDDFIGSLSDGVSDSDNSILRSPEYYEKKIEETRNHIDQIHELRALIKSMPSSSELNKKVSKSLKGKNRQSAANKCTAKWDEFAKKNPFIANWYEGIIESGIDLSSMEKQLEKMSYENALEVILATAIIDMDNQAKILPKRAEIYEKLEKYKQDRDMALFVKQSGIFKDKGVDLKNKTIHSFRLGQTIVYGYLDDQNNFQTFRNKEEFVNNALSKENYWYEWTKEKGKKGFEKQFDEEVEKVKAMGELESRLDSSGLMDKINLASITEYMNFDENSFDKMAKQYRISKLQKQIARPDASSASGGYDGEGKTNIIPDKEEIKETLKDNAIDISSKIPEIAKKAVDETKIPLLNWNIGSGHIKNSSLLLENINNSKPWYEDGEDLILINDDNTPIKVPKAEIFKGLCIDGGIGLAKCPLSVLSIIKNCTEVPQMMKEIARAGKLGNGGFFSDEVEQILEASNFITSDIIAESASAALEVTENISKILVGAGKMSIDTLSNVLSVTGAISAGIDIGKGIISTGKGVYDAAKATHDLHKAQNAETELGKYGKKKTAKNTRLLHQVQVTQREKRANGILNAVTGALDIANGVLSLVPGAQLAGTIIGIANMALGAIAKFAISKFFKSKKKDQAWSDILQFSSVDEYNKFESRVGTENFHRVLRRKTGVGTRQKFADSLNIIDAIDIYTMAKLHSGKADTKDTDEKIIQTTLSGMGYSDPSKYQYLRLSDVFGKVGADSDWKSVLKDAITDKKGVFNRKTREQKEDTASA